MDLPRFTVPVTLTQKESDRLDEICVQQDVDRDVVLLYALVAYDRLLTGKEDSVFERKATGET